MKKTLLLTYLLIGFGAVLWGQSAYFSRQSGSWASASTWSMDPSGAPIAAQAPTATDTVIIRHEVSHASGKNYIHYGNVFVELEGIYRINSGTGLSDPYFFAGNLFSVHGSLITSSDFENQLPFTTGPNGTGTFYAGPLAYIQFGDDFVLNSFSTTIVDNPACGKGSTADDVYFKGTNARLCGSGKLFVPDALRAWNNSNQEQANPLVQIASQVCAGFAIYSDSNDCVAGTNPILTGSGTFPVEWLSVEARQEGAAVFISWATASEKNNHFFTMERAIEGAAYEAIAQAPAAGNSDAVTAYHLTDYRPVTGPSRYRIRQTDLDGAESFSPAVEVWVKPFGLNVAARREAGSILIEAAGLAPGEQVSMSVIDLQGRLAAGQEGHAFADGRALFSLPALPASGVYFVRVATSSGATGMAHWVHP